LHLRARYYNPAVGRFLTADTVIPNPFGSQDWNRYAYVGNNPVVYVDPSGRCRGLSGAAFDACAAVVMATAAGVHKANEYRNDIFFPDANTTFADRLEAATVIGGGATLVSAVAAGGIALGGSGAVSTVSTSSAAALTGSGVAAAANVIGQAINKAETGERIDTGEVVVAGTIGYMAGALAPVGATTYLGAAALGGLSTVGQYSLTELNRGNACNITPEGVLYNAGLGIFFGGLAGPAPKGYSAFATYADNPAIRNKAIMDIHRSQLAEMVKTSSTSRAVLSGVGTTLNWDRVAERLREFGLIE